MSVLCVTPVMVFPKQVMPVPLVLMCAECSSNCMRSCTACAGEGRTAPNCGCADDETWNSATSTCDGEAEAESEPDTSSGNTSANILKFAAMVLLALLALL